MDEKYSKIRLVVMDVDGTLTDGGIYIDSNGVESKKFNAKDGAGIVMARRAGMKFMILTGRSSRCVEIRAAELGVDYLRQGEHDKLGFLTQFLAEHDLSTDEVAYIGDDFNDLDCMGAVELSACPSDAVAAVKSVCDLVLSTPGGKGAVRELLDMMSVY